MDNGNIFHDAYEMSVSLTKDPKKGDLTTIVNRYSVDLVYMDSYCINHFDECVVMKQCKILFKLLLIVMDNNSRTILRLYVMGLMESQRVTYFFRAADNF